MTISQFLKIIKKNGENNPLEIIPYIDTFKKLQIYNIEYIKGNIDETFYNIGRSNIDNKILKDIIQLNKLGFLSMDSEPSMCEYYKPIKNNLEGNGYSDYEKKPFISGFIKKDVIEKLNKYINKTPSLENIVFFVPHFLFNKNNRELKKGEKINLDREKVYYNIKDNKNAKWIEYSNFFYDDSLNAYYLLENYRNLQYILKDYAFCIIFIDEYCTEVNLFKQLLKFFKTIIRRRKSSRNYRKKSSRKSKSRKK
jgi:hypothetical protein